MRAKKGHFCATGCPRGSRLVFWDWIADNHREAPRGQHHSRRHQTRQLSGPASVRNTHSFYWHIIETYSYILCISRPTVNINAASASEMFKSVSPALILIDFGISLDMRLLPPGAEFKMAFENKDNRTPEMIEGKNWSYQVLFICTNSFP